MNLPRSTHINQGISVKIAAVERRSRFRDTAPSGEYVGIEVGADAASSVSLDEVMIFHDNPRHAQQFFQQLFYNHTLPRLPEDFEGRFDSAGSFVQAAFKKNAFVELVRAAEGVPRDAINGNDLGREILRRLIDEVVGKRGMRTFLLDQLTDAQHETIHELCDARLLHVLQRGITDRKKPGTLYDGFAIDYGCYVALLLDGTFQLATKGTEIRLTNSKQVPQDDFNLHRAVIDLTALRARSGR